MTTVPSPKKVEVRLYVKIRGEDAYRERTPAELKAVAERKGRAQRKKFYAKFGLTAA
jgi:hypothetical protein